MNKYTIQLLNKNSEGEVSMFLNLLKTNFKKPVEYYNWKHDLANKFKIEEYTFCIFQDNLCIATIQIIVNSLYSSGKQIRFGLLCDGATHKDYRRYGLFEQMLKHCVDFSKGVNIDFVYSTGNEKSRQALLKLGYQDFFTTIKAQKKLRYNQLLLKPLNFANELLANSKHIKRNETNKQISIELYFEFVNQIKHNYKLFFNKSLAHVRWRIKKPIGQYNIFGSFDEYNVLKAVAVININKSTLYIEDCIFSNESIKYFDSLLKFIEKQAWSHNDVVHINLEHNNFKETKSVFSSNGFKFSINNNNTLIKTVNKGISFSKNELNNMHYMRIDKNE